VAGLRCWLRELLSGVLDPCPPDKADRGRILHAGMRVMTDKTGILTVFEALFGELQLSFPVYKKIVDNVGANIVLLMYWSFSSSV
jgi:hypothetical protein